MKINTIPKPLQSSFLSIEKDCETILNKLFIESRPYSDDLKALLVLNVKDCLNYKSKESYLNKINSLSIKDLKEQQYIKFVPQITQEEYEEEKSRIIIWMDDFFPSGNPQFRNSKIVIQILCPFDSWDIGDYQIRPVKIAGFIDGILNNAKLSGIGTLQYFGGSMLPADETMGGYTLIYEAYHGSDDKIPNND